MEINFFKSSKYQKNFDHIFYCINKQSLPLYYFKLISIVCLKKHKLIIYTHYFYSEKEMN